MADAKTGNIQSIQFLRGIAAFMVLLNHGADIRSIPDTNRLKHMLLYGCTGVNVFFIISGFIIPYSMFINNYKLSDFKSFFLKRITRIEPPYIVSIFLVLLLSYIATLYPKYTGPAFTVNWLNVAGHVGYVNAFTGMPWLNSAYWTLAVEFEFYILLALVFPLLTHPSKIVMATTYTGLLLATFIPVTDRHILHFLPFFQFGIALFLLKSKKIPLSLFLYFLIITIAVCYENWGNILLVLSLVVLTGIYFIRKVPKAFLLLGTISYSLYLTHGILITRFMGLAERVLHGVNIWIAFGISAILCLVFAWIYYMTIERFFLKLSKKIRYVHPDEMNKSQGAATPVN